MSNPTSFKYQTPAWAAELIVQNFYPTLNRQDHIWEPTCGVGSFLLAFPPECLVTATDSDAEAVKEADILIQTDAHRSRNSRGVRTKVYHHNVQTPLRPGKITNAWITHVIGNPPFKRRIVDAILTRAKEEGLASIKVGLVLSAAMLQTSRSVMQWAKDWHISVNLLPRDLFPGLQTPLVFAEFRRRDGSAGEPELHGLRLYGEIANFRLGINLPTQRRLAIPASGGVWFNAVYGLLTDAKEGMTLEEIYRALENRRPTTNPWWREQIRKVLYRDQGHRLVGAGGRWSAKF